MFRSGKKITLGVCNLLRRVSYYKRALFSLTELDHKEKLIRSFKFCF